MSKALSPSVVRNAEHILATHHALSGPSSFCAGCLTSASVYVAFGRCQARRYALGVMFVRARTNTSAPHSRTSTATVGVVGGDRPC